MTRRTRQNNQNQEPMQDAVENITENSETTVNEMLEAIANQEVDTGAVNQEEDTAEQSSKGSSESTNSQRIFQNRTVTITGVEPPRLEEFSRESLVKFMEKRRLYLSHCGQYSCTPVPFRDMIELDLRQALSGIVYEATASEVDSEELNEAVEKHLLESQATNVDRDEAFQQFKMDFKHTDPLQRVVAYKQEINKMLENNGWYVEYHSTASMRKKLIKYVIQGVRPRSVQNALKTRMDKQPAPLITHMGNFWKELTRLAKAQNEFGGPRKSNKSTKNSSNGSKHSRKRNQSDSDSNHDKKKIPKKGNNDSGRSGKRPLKCFGCDEEHRLSDCKKYDDEQKKGIMLKMKEKWKKKRSQKNE